MTTQKLIRNLIKNYGEDPDREGLKETPFRVEKAYDELLSGYKSDVQKVFKTFDTENYTGQITLKNIPFSSLCEHHLLPFFGTVDITYTPKRKILGLSKFARLIDIFSKRLQIQERLTKQIAESIKLNLDPQSCTVTIKAKHLCMNIRGVKKSRSFTITTYTV